ncbi:HAMP domain-containing histidine kinase, partial [bacterium]
PLYLNIKIQEELVEKALLDSKIQISLPESTFEIFFSCNLIPTNTYPNNQLLISEFSILSHYDYRLIGKITSEGNAEGIYYCNRLIEDSFNIPFNIPKKEVLSIESDRLRNINGIKLSETYSIGEFYFDIRIFDRDPESIDKLSKIFNTSGKKETSALLDQIIGLRISKNGFGVKPYGEEDKDWMGLGQMRVQNPTEIIGTNQVIGNIFLFSPQNDALNEKTNREGFFENEAFINFKKALRSIMIQIGKKRHNYREKHNIGRKIKSRNTRPDSSRFLNFIKTLTTDSEAINEAESYLKEITTTLDNLENSLTFSQRLATLGSGLELVYHELAQPISIIGKCLFGLKFSIGQVNNLDLRNDFLTETDQIRKSNETLNSLKSSLEPAIGRSKKAKFKPLDTFNKVLYLLTKDISSNKIDVEIDGKLKEYTLNDHEYNFWISFLNILNNGVYWLQNSSTSERKIIFSLDNDNSLRITNNGPLIDPGELDNIFNYGVTHKQDKKSTGLGLAFTRSLLSTNGWDIYAENSSKGPSFILKQTKT